jgi:hypothetical protein
MMPAVKKEVAPELKAEVISLYFANLGKPFEWVVEQMKGKLTHYMCDRVVQDFLKSKKDLYITLESKMNYD